MKQVHARLIELLDRGERVAVATIVRGRGSRPRETGARMLVVADGSTHFSVGGGALEASIVAECRSLLAEGGEPRIVRHDLTEHGARSVGMTCGGSVETFIEIAEPARRLFVFGGGHVGRALAEAARLVGLPVSVIDDRAEWLRPDDFPPGTALHRCARDYRDDLPPLAGSDLAAVMTRCHATDVAVLRHLATEGPSYVGFIGSRRKILGAFRALEVDHAVSRAFLDRVHAPIGLDIGAQTPGEIAVAVAAEIVAHLRGLPTGAASPERSDVAASPERPGSSGRSGRSEGSEGSEDSEGSGRGTAEATADAVTSAAGEP